MLVEAVKELEEALFSIEAPSAGYHRNEINKEGNQIRG